MIPGGPDATGGPPHSTAGVVVADDDPGVRSAIAALVAGHEDLRLIEAVGDGLGAIDVCARERPTLAIVDVMMPAGGGEAVAGIRAVSPHTVVVVHTARSDRRLHRQLLAAGADLVLVKGSADLIGEIVELTRRGRSS